MLHKDDLTHFLETFEHATRAVSPEPVVEEAAATLRIDHVDDEHMVLAEVKQLSRAARIARNLGDVTKRAEDALAAIASNLSEHNGRFHPVVDAEPWTRAIRWALLQDPPTPEGELLDRYGREARVGAACERLRERGYRVAINAFGPVVDEDAQRQIVNDVDVAVAGFGGTNALREICNHMRTRGLIHDGMWLHGNRVGSTPTDLSRLAPALPIGWLLAVALRHIHRAPDSPDVDGFREGLELAVDYAAANNCQRYNQFERINIDPVDYARVLDESLRWRELFSVPQVPGVAVATLREAFALVEWPDGELGLRREVDGLFLELGRLLQHPADHRVTVLPCSAARKTYRCCGSVRACCREASTRHSRSRSACGVAPTKERSSSRQGQGWLWCSRDPSQRLRRCVSSLSVSGRSERRLPIWWAV